MIVSIHQPNFIPFIGFFEKMEKSDIFILLDNVQFTKGGYQNRVKIYNSIKEEWLSIPVEKKSFICTNELKIRKYPQWKLPLLSHLDSIAKYNKSNTCTNLIFDLISNSSHELMVDLNIEIIGIIVQELQIKTKLIRSSEILPDLSNQSASQKLLSLCNEVGAKVYLSGSSGKDYLDKNLFKSNHIDLEFHENSYKLKGLNINENVPNAKSLSIVCSL